jgi:adenylate cyclase
MKTSANKQLISKDGNEKARQWFESALKHDPKYADAYAYFGWNYFYEAGFQWGRNTQAAMEKAQELAQKALDLDNSNSPALALLTELDLHQGRIERAVADGEREIALNPNSFNGYAALSDALASDGQPQEAIHVAEKGMRLDPALHAWYAYFIGHPYVDMGRYEEAIPLLKEHVTTFPDQVWGHYMLAGAYTALGRNQEAQAEASEVRRISPQFGCKDITLKNGAARIRAESFCHKLGFK